MNIFFTNNDRSTAINLTPTWAAGLIKKAKEAKEETISLGDVPSGWYEFIVFKAENLLYRGMFIEVKVDEFEEIVRRGMPALSLFQTNKYEKHHERP